MRLEDMTPVMLGRAKECKTPGERLALMAEEGVELTDEQLEGISGGGWDDGNLCPKDPTGMQSHKWVRTGKMRGNATGGPGEFFQYRCEYCGKEQWSAV